MSEETIKVALIGDKSVGKTRSIIQLTSNTYDKELHDSHASEEVHYFEFKVDGKKCCLIILDTSTNPDYQLPDRKDFLMSCDGCVMMYSMDLRHTFASVSKMKDEFFQLRGLNERDHFPMVLASCKCDIEFVREVSRKEAEELAVTWHSPYVEFSNKDHKSVEGLWSQIVKEVRKQRGKK